MTGTRMLAAELKLIASPGTRAALLELAPQFEKAIDYFSVAAMRRISAGECSPESGVPGIRYFPIASPPTGTGS